MNHRNHILAPLAVLALAACHETPATAPEPESAPPPHDESSHQGPADQIQAWLEPSDLTTDSGTTPIGIRLRWPGFTPAPEVFSDIARGLTLTDAFGDTVPANFAPPDGDLSEFAGSAFIQIVPHTELAPGWYVLRMADVETTPAVAIPDHQRLPTGQTVVRFRIGSQPIVQQIRICERRPGSWDVRADLSERVLDGDALARASLVREASAACERHVLVDHDLPGGDETVGAIAWECAEIGERESLELVVPSGAMGLTGVPVTPVPGIEFSRSMGFQYSPECVVIRGVLPDATIPAYDALNH